MGMPSFLALPVVKKLVCEVMCAEGRDRFAKVGVPNHRIRDGPLLLGLPQIRRHDLHPLESTRIEHPSEQLDVFHIVLLLVPDADVVDIDAMVLPGAFDERGDKPGVVFGVKPPVADPSGSPPLQGFDQDTRIPVPGLPHQPPLVAALEVFRFRILKLLARASVAWLRTVGGVDVTPDFDLQVVQAGAESGLKEVVENLGALRFRVVVKQARGRAGAECPDAFEQTAF